MKFKIGDWVRIFDDDIITIHRLDINKLYLVKQLYKDSAELWQPKEGEWCWYGFELVQVIDVDNQHIKICRQQSDSYEEILVSSLEPFTNTLPSFTKDNE